MSRPRERLGQELALLGFAAEVPFPGISGKRRYRWDWALPERRIAVEYQGIIGKSHGHGDASHASIAGMLRDHEKFSEASVLGWTVILANARTAESGQVIGWVLAALERAEREAS